MSELSLDLPPASGRWSQFRRSRAVGLTGKLLVIASVIWALAGGLALLQDLVRERERRHVEVQTEIQSLWGEPQLVTGPVLAVPYGIPGDEPGIEHVEPAGSALFLPSQLNFDAQLQPEIRHRGIFETVVYRGIISMKGRFKRPATETLRERFPQIPADTVLLWHRATMTVGITDLRSVPSSIELNADGKPLPFRPTSAIPELIPNGISAALPAETLVSADRDGVSFAVDLRLQGSDTVQFLPLGEATTAVVESTWPDPSFNGAYLPNQYVADPDGFVANWTISYFGRDYPQIMLGETANEDLRRAMVRSSFGVALHQPVTPYRKVERAVKYGLLFLIFTFAYYFIVEVTTGRPIHAVQYATVGVPLCLFFLLLVAFAEHIGFLPAYICGVLAVLSLIGYYSSRMLESRRQVLLICGLLSGLYGYLYSLLELESYSLLWGAIGLWALTAVFMHVTRKLDWYQSEMTEAVN